MLSVCFKIGRGNNQRYFECCDTFYFTGGLIQRNSVTVFIFVACCVFYILQHFAFCVPTIFIKDGSNVKSIGTRIII